MRASGRRQVDREMEERGVPRDDAERARSAPSEPTVQMPMRPLASKPMNATRRPSGRTTAATRRPTSRTCAAGAVGAGSTRAPERPFVSRVDERAPVRRPRGGLEPIATWRGPIAMHVPSRSACTGRSPAHLLPERNAIQRPSGDHAGARPRASSRSRPPLRICTCRPSGFWIVSAKRLPSGANDGPKEPCGSLPKTPGRPPEGRTLSTKAPASAGSET